MKVKINGKVEDVKKALNIAGLLSSKGLPPQFIVVEHNSRIVPQDRFESVSLDENDSLEIVTFVGGG